MKKLIIFSLVLVLLSCKKEVDLENINQLNGYWQISKAENTNGDKKEYPINEVYDYFEFKNKTGLHKKVVWQPTGKFLVNDMQENISIKKIEGEVFINFSSRYGKHVDKLESISAEEMILMSKDNVKYYYKKVVLEEDKYGEKNQ